ncbi:unnamed protein product [Euphydryas editha]|uniref:Uncharacterized protein n=1 Tax=Euphydryas editha TaxID=104508 RepID=A0AAU9U3Y9_EUPED|nr:unnamed protein product [Euphydryas editha]
MDQSICIKFCVKNICIWRMVKLPWTKATFIGDENISKKKKIILANLKITGREIAEDLNNSTGSSHWILTNDLGMRRVAAKFVQQ